MKRGSPWRDIVEKVGRKKRGVILAEILGAIGEETLVKLAVKLKESGGLARLEVRIRDVAEKLWFGRGRGGGVGSSLEEEDSGTEPPGRTGSYELGIDVQVQF